MGRVDRIFRTYNSNDNPWHIMVHEDFKKQPGILMFFTGFEPTLFIKDVELLNELYVTKNKYFDKHPRIGMALKPMLGDSLLFMRNNETWSKKRKSVSMTFYKDKLVKYFSLIKTEQLKHCKEIKEMYVKTGKPMDLISVVTIAHIKVLL